MSAAVLKVLNGLPGLLLAALAVGGAFQVYIHNREQRAVERASWVRERDSIIQESQRDSAAAAVLDSTRVATIKRLDDDASAWAQAAQVEGHRGDALFDSLRAVVDSGVGPLLDSLQASHTREVLSLRQALVKADSIHAEDSLRIADRDRQLADLRRSNADAIGRADHFEKQANPGWVRRVVESPVTHIVAAGIGYALGDK